MEDNINNNYKEGLIILFGGYPIGSWPNRVRLWMDGFNENNVKTTLILPFPYLPASYVEEPNVFYLQNLILNPKKNLSYFIKYIVGVIKAFLFVKKNSQKLNFVLFAGGSFASCFMILNFCKRKKIRFMIEIVDENSKKYSESKLALVDRLAILNKYIFDKFIVKKVDTLFVLSSFLEKKYRQLFPDLEIRRTVPTLINYEQFLKNSKKNIFELNLLLLKVFKSPKIKLLYAGSCERTNGIFFFLNSISQLIKRAKFDVEIIFLFYIGNVNKVVSYCQELAISDYVTVLPAILPVYIPAIYNHCDILILPEHGNVIANAGFPGKVAEYLASGKAILSTKFSDIPIYLKHGYNAMLADIGDQAEYTANLYQLLNDSSLRKSLGINALNTSREYFDNKEASLIYLKDL